MKKQYKLLSNGEKRILKGDEFYDPLVDWVMIGNESEFENETDPMIGETMSDEHLPIRREMEHNDIKSKTVSKITAKSKRK